MKPKKKVACKVYVIKLKKSGKHTLVFHHSGIGNLAKVGMVVASFDLDPKVMVKLEKKAIAAYDKWQARQIASNLFHSKEAVNSRKLQRASLRSLSTKAEDYL